MNIEFLQKQVEMLHDIEKLKDENRVVYKRN